MLRALLLLSTLSGSSAATLSGRAAAGVVVRGSQARVALHKLRGGSDLPLIYTEEELELELEYAGASTLVVVDFMAEWCGPCKKLAPILESLAAKTAKSGKVKFFAVDVDQARELAAAQNVKSMPTILFFRGGRLVNRIVGADVAALKAEVAKATMNPILRNLKSENLMIAAAVAYMTLTLTPLKAVLPPAMRFA